MGLQYIHLERDGIKGIPQFVRPLSASV
jgi:hypothetical protein